MSPFRPSFEPLFLVLCAASAIRYARWATTSGAGRRHRTFFFLGLALVTAALNSPIETIASRYLLLFHLLQNVMISDWARHRFSFSVLLRQCVRASPSECPECSAS